MGQILTAKKINAVLIKMPNIPLLVQICLVYQLSRQQIQFSNFFKRKPKLLAYIGFIYSQTM